MEEELEAEMTCPILNSLEKPLEEEPVEEAALDVVESDEEPAVDPMV